MLHLEGSPPFPEITTPLRVSKPLLLSTLLPEIHCPLHLRPKSYHSGNPVPPGRNFRLLQPRIFHFPLFLPQLLGCGAPSFVHSILLTLLCLNISSCTIRGCWQCPEAAPSLSVFVSPRTRLPEWSLPFRDETQSNALGTEMRTEAHRREVTCQRAHTNLAPDHRCYHLRARP